MKKETKIQDKPNQTQEANSKSLVVQAPQNEAKPKPKQKKKPKKSGGIIVLYTFLIIGLQGIIAASIIGILAVASYGEIITIGSAEGDLAFMCTSIAALFNVILFIVYALLLGQKNKVIYVNEELIEEVEVKSSSRKEEVRQEAFENKNKNGFIPPIPTGNGQAGDKKWMSHTKVIILDDEEEKK